MVSSHSAISASTAITIVVANAPLFGDAIKHDHFTLAGTKFIGFEAFAGAAR
jgi:hypothetical protein